MTRLSGSSAPSTPVVIGDVVENPSIRFSATIGSERSVSSSTGMLSVPSSLPANTTSIGKGRPAAPAPGSNTTVADGGWRETLGARLGGGVEVVIAVVRAGGDRQRERGEQEQRSGVRDHRVASRYQLKCQLSWALKMSTPESYSPRIVVLPGDSAPSLSIGVSSRKRCA